MPLTRTERLGLAVGSGLMSFLDPRRGDLIAAFGEATAQPYFINRLRDRMLLHPTGRRILRDRPRLTSTSLDIPRLRSLPKNTVGYVYTEWLDREGVSPDTRAQVRYIDDEECAYVMQRYRECHDFYHALVGLPVFREGEVALKAFEFANTGLPMTGLAVLSAFTLKKGEWRRFWDIYGPWAVRNGAKSEDVINVYWEEELETDVDELRTRLGIEKPPDLRDLRKAAREARKKEKTATEAATGAAV
ncbi:Ubiquinone biosynthesis protein [Didymosphaeria variabile]|uniref:4-hydroxy-3-methoxy-5-polyprenylbenzoate decarboxylase n=1 Tax=Didymosphaeria variabile TaxID=1932322 RepID=A0A9W9CDX3_9PLEO|nr:Ubiquinone biosynthesis protein [Didymosphaeria variabile]KAJ4358191.1 Ubiquinone biosynthesis protein [Didymosphaeria variabile]